MKWGKSASIVASAVVVILGVAAAWVFVRGGRSFPGASVAEPEIVREKVLDPAIATDPPDGGPAVAASDGGGLPAVADVLAEIHDMSDPAVRAEVVRRAQALEDARARAVREKARRLGLAMEGDLPGGGRFALVDFEGDRPVYDNTENANAAISIGTNRVRSTTPFDVDGAGMTVGLWEAGGVPMITHQEFGSISRVTVVQGTTPTSHATHVAGTLIAAGVFPSVKGMAPGARIRAYDSSSDSVEMLVEGAATAGEVGKIMISNHSYGSSRGWEGDIWHGTFSNDGNPANDADQRFGRYDSTSVSMDGLTRNLPYYLPFFSAGNHGNDGPPAAGTVWYEGSVSGTKRTYVPSLHPMGDGSYKGGFDTCEGKKLAKNVMTVGATLDAVTGSQRNPAAGTLTAFSSTGPVDDGRIKPDIVTNGDSLTSSTSEYFSATGDFSGTSMASPGAAGSALLLQQYYGKRFPGGAMRASTLKALILHTADDLGNPGPDYRYGWGLMNTRAAADLIKMHADGGAGSIVEGQLTSTVKSATHTFPSKGTAPLRFTLCWTDPAGAAKSSGHDIRTPDLVNNLNLIVSGPAGTSHLPYVMPHVGDWSQASLSANATTGVNNVDNVEQVDLAAPPASGSYVVTVSFSGSLAGGTQAYSLIASGISPPPLTALETWRQTHFGTTAGTGSAANHADYDSDGLSNVIEFAFGLDPKNRASNSLPQGRVIGGNFVVSFPTPAGVSGVTYAAESSASLAAGDWKPVVDQGVAGNHLFSLPVAGAPRRFVRLKVVVP